MKIYTRTGDNGSTSLISGERVLKTDARIEVCGALDELSCAIGLARAASPSLPGDKSLVAIQRHLFELGADLAATGKMHRTSRLGRRPITWMESEIDRLEAELPPLKNFILPGGRPAAAQIHFSRAICRRAERSIVSLSESEEIGMEGIIFLNRLSDFLFVLARYENFLSGVSEETWKGDRAPMN
jgi:cob(I)alamin adenosyltransferase